MNLNQMNIQLKEAGQLTGSAWAIWLERSGEWGTLGFYNITTKQRSLVLTWLNRPSFVSWLNGGLYGKHILSRKIPKNPGIIGEKLYIFPNQLTQRVILVCADNLSKAALRFWGGVSLGNSGRSDLDPEIVPFSSNCDGGKNYVPHSLDGILNLVMKVYPCQGGWLATQTGDILQIKADSTSSNWKGKQLSIKANPLLGEVSQTRKARIVLKKDAEWEGTPHLGGEKSTRFWIGLPLVVGKRVSGIVVLWGRKPPSDAELEKQKSISQRIAPSVERCITVSELNQQLYRMRLMNDFAETIHSSLDLDQIVQSTFALLQSAFSVERIFFMTMFPADSGTKCYFKRHGSIISEDKPDSILPAQLLKGKTFRFNTRSAESFYKPTYPGSKSTMISPLMLRKRVIGALGLENESEGAFTLHDEHFLVVIAQYMSSLLENGWLRQEAEARVRNLVQIGEIIKQVIGCTDIRRMAQLAAEIISYNFDGELAVVSLERGPIKELQVAGISGIEADLVQKEMKYLKLAMEKGIEMRVATTGQNVLINDVKKDPYVCSHS